MLLNQHDEVKSMIMDSGFDNGQNQQFMGCIDLLRELAENMAASEEEIGSTMATKRVADPSSTDA